MAPASLSSFTIPLRPGLLDILAGLLLAVLSLMVALTYADYGITVDEGLGLQRAARTFAFITSLGRDFQDVARFERVNFYGAMPDLLALVLQLRVPSLSFDSRHLVSALFGVCGVFYLYRLGAMFVSKAVGFFAALFLACNPMWLGYMFVNLKDIPFAATLLASLYYSLSALALKPASGMVWLKAGLAVGLLATTKLIGILVLGFFGLLTLVALAVVPTGPSLQVDRLLLTRLCKLAAASVVGCLLCFAVFWPQFYFYQPRQLATVMETFMNYELWRGAVRINGADFSERNVPWYYLSTYWLISMPVYLLALGIAGVALGVCKRQPLIIAFTVICAACFAYQAMSGAPVYNGYRLFLFLLPPAMLIAAYPIGFLVEADVSRLVRATALVVIAVLIGTTIWSMYRLFPYQYSFYNVLVGGIAGADGKYEIDIWQSALREALREISRTASGTVRVYFCGSTLNIAGVPRLEQAKRIEEADYVVALRADYVVAHYAPCVPDYRKFPTTIEIRREGVLLAAVFSPAAAK